MLHIAALPLLALALAGAVASAAAAEPYADTVTFLRVGDEEQAVNAVRNGTLDIHYWPVPHHLVEDQTGIRVFEVPVGGSLSLLLNPAEGERFNPFQLSPVRFAVHHLVDRERIVDEVLGGYGSPIVTPFAPYHPDYSRTLEAAESFVIRHDPALAQSIIDKAMTGAGGSHGGRNVDGRRRAGAGRPVHTRRRPPIRLNIGEALASALENAGFCGGAHIRGPEAGLCQCVQRGSQPAGVARVHRGLGKQLRQV